MGTEVESKMYLPECNHLRDVNDSAGSGGWALNYENRNLKSDQYGGTFSFRPLTDEYVGYYKDQLRQTILKHEYIFRHQVRELHRLYNVQRDMMNEIKRKELDKFLLPAGSSHQSCLKPYPYGFLSEGDRDRWQTPNLPFDRPSASDGNGMQPHFDSLKGTTVQFCGPDKSGLRLGDCESLQPKYNTLQKSSFDVELPANDIISNEEVGQGISSASRTKNYNFNLNFDITSEKDGNSPIRCGFLSGSDGDAFSSNVHLRSTDGLTNLNESFQLEEASRFASVNILCTSTHPKEYKGRQDLSISSYSGFQRLSNEFPQDPGNGKDRITSRSNLHSEAEYKHKGWPAYNSEAGQSRSNRSFCLGNSSTLSQDEQHKVHEHLKFPFSEQNRTEPHRKRKLFGVDISDRNNDASVVASQVLGPSLVVQFDATNSESSQVSSRKNLPASYNWNLITAQGNPYSHALPQLSKSSKTLMPGPTAVGENFLVDSSSGSVPEFRSEVSYQNDHCIGSHWDSKKARTCHPLVGFNNACGISDSNSASECRPKNNSEVLGSIMDAKSAEAMSASAVPPNVYQMNLDFLQDLSQQSINKTEMRKDPSRSSVQDALSATHTHDANHMRYEVGDSSSRKILGLPIYQKNMSQDLFSNNSPSKSSFVASATDGSNSIKVGLLDTDLNRDPESSKSEGRPKVEGPMVEKEPVNRSAGLKHHIDLNLCASEDEGQLTPSCLGANVKIADEREMESPIIMGNKACVDHELESIESRLEETFNSSGDESMEPLEGLVKIAADSLVAISSSEMPYQGNSICDQLEASLSDSLQWFAEIITSYKCDIEDEVSISFFKDVVSEEDSVPNGLDHFEFMTLNLTETKVEECTYKPQVLENSEHEEKPLPRRPRRGQARRGRQRKDFQREVLPSLSILSRNEVNDDLQIIEGMVRAAGGTWQSSLSQRNTAKSTSGRGRRRRGGATNSRTATAACPSENQQPKCREPGLEVISLAGWGKRTRRLPRQRCPDSNNPSNK
ncbi:hypothetical protein HS088_TW15G01077 [Tripterygium wilfordii]|uniref:Uncharacterized protein n=1 Tax=Tripterygium wilfordii TaxID=458696 RepID=A0A7J7CNH9_TRIWF|nr:uncharacterized protein LOC120016872 [Tripterygium wilfordii]XP_038725759.1 uncharacterized protein LOC120016872 [Tripterygium wilfordii]XP_038725760.1 uncharacterized protein LOC120016872 [Tripterygium wilfordii]KAF5735569.1 hypothetical protein HS088_TW15G01077 [Tripterygium wilfordii]